ncbi:MAG: glycosyltransferase [Deltaproteobacteria bacterium]|nr:glycosyltransferase [Deltaproteobacteria bacterium]
MISVVCPFYNEEQILRWSVQDMLKNLKELPDDWELIIVNDGSTDESYDIAKEISEAHSSVQLISYTNNRGRGHALITGIRAAKGELIFTTEIDSSWGDHVVRDMYNAFQEDPSADIIIASPHLPGGGYRNVPPHRTLLSQVGNIIIRMGLGNSPTMNTGMTRGYRRNVIQSLPLYEEGKEFHLEVVLKALTLGKKITEVPATLEWKDYKQEGKTEKRKSSSKIKKLIRTHLFFSIFAAPIRYLWGLSIIFAIAGASSGIYAFIRYMVSEPYAYGILGCIAFIILAVLLFSFGVITQQNSLLMRELWDS